MLLLIGHRRWPKGPLSFIAPDTLRACVNSQASSPPFLGPPRRQSRARLSCLLPVSCTISPSAARLPVQSSYFLLAHSGCRLNIGYLRLTVPHATLMTLLGPHSTPGYEFHCCQGSEHEIVVQRSQWIYPSLLTAERKSQPVPL